MDRTARKPWLTLAFVDSVVIFPDERGWLPLNSHEMCHTFHFLCFIIPTKESQDEVTLSECKGPLGTEPCSNNEGLSGKAKCYYS